jgi:tellurite resistance protein TerC
MGLAVILAFIGVKLVMEALHDNSLPFINGGEHITAVPHIPIWLSLSIILGVLVIATVASLVKTRGQLITVDETLVDPETADRIPSDGPEALAEAEPRIVDESDEQRTRR